jgi:hypothetical protein
LSSSSVHVSDTPRMRYRCDITCRLLRQNVQLIVRFHGLYIIQEIHPVPHAARGEREQGHQDAVCLVAAFEVCQQRVASKASRVSRRSLRLRDGGEERRPAQRERPSPATPTTCTRQGTACGHRRWICCMLARMKAEPDLGKGQVDWARQFSRLTADVSLRRAFCKR